MTDLHSPQEQSGLLRWIPAVGVVRSYQRSWFSHDITAGLVLTALLVPAGMGYAQASGLPAIYGLYATIVPLLVYALLGPSRILVLGPDSALAPLIAVAVVSASADGEAQAVALAGLLAILSGVFHILGAVLRLGFISELLSKPVRYGYMNGIALTVLLSQAPTLFGFSVDANGAWPEAREFARGLRDGQTNSATLLIGGACLVTIIACKRWLPKVPGVLLAVVGATVVVAAFGLHESQDVRVVGALPRGLPGFEIPNPTIADWNTLLAAAFGIALVSFADTSVLSRTFATRGGYKVDANQELVALGAANVAAGVFQGFSISSSASRTPVAEAAGAKSQLTGVVGALAIMLLLLFFPNLVRDLPNAALAAVVISAAIGLFEIAGMRHLYELRKSEFFLSLACFGGVVAFGVIEGIFIAVGLSLFDFIRRASRPYSAVLGRVDNLKGYHDITRYPEARQIPGLVLFRWDAPLFFANAETFASNLRDAVRSAPARVRWVVVTAEPVTDLDTTAADIIRDLDAELSANGIDFRFAEMKDPVKDHMKRYALLERLGPDHFYPTIGAAVSAFVRETGSDWVDWEDRMEAEQAANAKQVEEGTNPSRSG